MELKFRRPVAMVEVQRNLYPVMYPIDAEGILLPASDFSMADAERYPIIKNVTSEPPGPAGMSWGDVRIIGAARLAEKLVGQYWNEFGLTAIYVPQDVKANTTIDDLIYELETSGGSRIIWGRPPGTGHPGEISADKKIGRLKYLLALFGDFDKPHGPYLINIRHWQDISRHPISIQQSRALK